MNIKCLIKLACSAVAAFVILNIVCFFYYNVPVHSESKTNSTDYIWEVDKFYSKGTEGFAFGKTDSNGFNNLSTEYSVSPEILVMGSSHTEGFNVSQEENYVSLLNSFAVSNGNDFRAYNIGVSGHTAAICFNNLENAVDEFKPSKYVVIEVNSVDLSMDDIENISAGTVKKIHSSANPILIFLQKIPFVRCVYYQLDKMDFDVKKDDNKNENVSSENETDSDSAYEYAVNELLYNMKAIAQENGIRLIIMLNTSLNIDEGGNVVPYKFSSEEKAFVSACHRNGIDFIDMRDEFSKKYCETNKLPHGFSNTAIGVGHLNKYGHETIANVLYEHISALEKNNLIGA